MDLVLWAAPGARCESFSGRLLDLGVKEEEFEFESCLEFLRHRLNQRVS